MQANEMLEYANKIIEAFRNGTFLSAHLKKSDGAAYDYALKDVSKCIMKIDSMAKNINLSLFNEFFEFITSWLCKVSYEFKKYRRKQRICNWGKKRASALKENKKMSEKEKKSANETLKIIKEILDCNKNAQKFFLVASEVDKQKWEPKTKENIAEKTKLRRERIAEIARKEKSINNKLFDYYFGYSNPSNMRNRLINVTGETKKIG